MASKKKQRKKGYKLCHTQGCLADKAEVFMFLYQEVIITLIQYASQMKREGLYKLYSFQVLKTQSSLVKVCMVNFCRKTISLFFLILRVTRSPVLSSSLLIHSTLCFQTTNQWIQFSPELKTHEHVSSATKWVTSVMQFALNPWVFGKKQAPR